MEQLPVRAYSLEHSNVSILGVPERGAGSRIEHERSGAKMEAAS